MAYGVYSDRGYREHILERNKNSNKTEVLTQEDQTFTGRKTFLSGVTTSDLEVRTVEVSESLKVKGKDITLITGYQGNWNAETNEPPLSDGMEGATSGDFYIVSVAGSHDFGSGEVSFLVNDRVIYNKENKWEKLAGGNVRSVNGKEPDNATGNITLYGTDILISETERINIIEKIKHYVGTTLLGRYWTQSNKTNGIFDGGARYANGIWVACNNANGGLWYSTDGMNWTKSNVSSGSFRGGARYANGIWVACSNGNGLCYSDVQTLINNGWLK